MSLLRQRAIECRTESTLSALSPALARLRLVRATSSDSDEASKEPLSQARLRAGAARLTADVNPKTRATASASRREPGRLVGLAPSDMRSGTSLGNRQGFRCCGHGSRLPPPNPSCDGPGWAGFAGTGRFRQVLGPLEQSGRFGEGSAQSVPP